MRDADRVAGVVGGIGLKQFHAVRRIPLGGKLGHHELLVVVYGAHTGRVVAAVSQDSEALDDDGDDDDDDDDVTMTS